MVFHHFKILFLIIYMFNFPTKSSLSKICDEPDRKQTCECNLLPANRSVFVEINGRYNPNVYNNFVRAVNSLQYCSGSFFCKPHFKWNQLIDEMPAGSHLTCFSDDNCLSNGYDVNNGHSKSSADDKCVSNKCADPKEMLTFNITNDIMEMDAYKCIKVGRLSARSQFCLKPYCKRFTAIEKLCTCDFSRQNCSCSTYCSKLHASISHKTYALFISFGDLYVASGQSINYLSYFILCMLCIGSIVIVIVFCNFYIALNRIATADDAQSTETLRRILSANMNIHEISSPEDKDEVQIEPPPVGRGSPPPSYEQVLKDKCKEFKESIR